MKILRHTEHRDLFKDIGYAHDSFNPARECATATHNWIWSWRWCTDKRSRSRRLCCSIIHFVQPNFSQCCVFFWHFCAALLHELWTHCREERIKKSPRTNKKAQKTSSAEQHKNSSSTMLRCIKNINFSREFMVFELKLYETIILWLKYIDVVEQHSINENNRRKQSNFPFKRIWESFPIIILSALGLVSPSDDDIMLRLRSDFAKKLFWKWENYYYWRESSDQQKSIKKDDDTFNRKFMFITLSLSSLSFNPQNGFVECEKNSCPAVDDCYTLVKKSSGTCCDKCRECYYKGKTFPSGHEWRDPDDPCLHYKCIAGVVTESLVQCYSPCSNPLPPRPGECCPTCLGELFFAFSAIFSHSTHNILYM